MACRQVLFPLAACEKAMRAAKALANAAQTNVDPASTTVLTDKKSSHPSCCNDNVAICSEIDWTAFGQDLDEGVSETARKPGTLLAMERGARPQRYTQDLPGALATSRKQGARKQRSKLGITPRPRQFVASLRGGSRAEGLRPVGRARRATRAHRSRGV